MLDRMKITRVLTLAACCLAPLIQAADRHAVDWTKLEAETMGHYISLLRIDTSNPPGDETKAVNYLKPILEAAGIQTEVFALDPKRANLVARIKGNGSKRRSPPSAKMATSGGAALRTTNRTWCRAS